jgi:long-chain acyl-CoA synthetase
MKTSDPLLEAWHQTLARKRDAPAIFDANGAILRTFRQIDEAASAFHIKLAGLEPGSVIAIQVGNHQDWPSLLIACLQQELIIIPMDRSISKQEREAALSICGARAVVTPAVSGGHNEIVPLKIPPATTDWGKKTPSLLKLTSGTTARPRAIRFQTAQLLADCDNICDTMGIGETDVNFAVVPISHSYGFSNLLTPLLSRGVSLALTDERLPRSLLHDLARTKATVFAGMPLFFQAFCEFDERPELPDLRLCISAAAPLTAAVAKKFRAKFNLPIHSFYGSSECGGICYDGADLAAEDGFVGRPMSNVNITFIDPAAESSQIRVRSAAVGDGYFPEPDDEKLSRGVFVPDDLLARFGSGFKIVGRISDVINVAGKKVNPAEVEAQLLQFAGVREAIVFGRKSSLRNQEVAACVVAAPEIRESDLLTFCRTRLSAWQVPKQIFLLDQIPVNERGKTSRRELAERFGA